MDHHKPLCVNFRHPVGCLTDNCQNHHPVNPCELQQKKGLECTNSCLDRHYNDPKVKQVCPKIANSKGCLDGFWCQYIHPSEYCFDDHCSRIQCLKMHHRYKYLP